MSDYLNRQRPPERIIGDQLRHLAIEMQRLGCPQHAWAIRLIGEDFEKLAALEREQAGGPTGPDKPE